MSNTTSPSGGSSSPILVIGSTGKTGSRIARQLAERGYAVRGASRRSEPPFDWERPETWAPALRGVRSAYVAFVPDLAADHAPSVVEDFCSTAARSGVERLVLLSGRGETNAERCERIVRASGLAFTLIRASWFAQNFSEGYLLDSVLEGTIALPAGRVKEPFVDVDDIADVAVAALTDRRHDGQLYELTGPQLLDFGEAAAEIASASGRRVEYVPITPEAFHAALIGSVGPEIADMLTGLCKEVFDGRNACLADGVRRALGREPRDFATYCRAAAGTGVWSR